MNPKGKGGFQDHPELINRKGRKPAGKTATDKAVTFFTGMDPKRRKYRDILLFGIAYEKAMKGSDANIKLCISYLLGNPTQRVDLGNPTLDRLMEEVRKI